MKLMDKIRNKIIDWLNITNIGGSYPISITQRLEFEANAVKNKIWYRGDSDELSEMYKQLQVDSTRFWKAVPSVGMEIRKIHTGLPKLIVNTLANIVIGDFDGVKIESETDNTLQDVWDEISTANSLDKLIDSVAKNALVVGDGAFKITFDRSVDEEYPIVEYVNGEHIDFKYNRGRLVEIVFYTRYLNDHRKYTLEERYGYGFINYRLLDSAGREVPTNTIPQTAWIDGNVVFDKSVILAVPVIYGNSQVYPGRGESIYDGKEDAFDAFDEIWSQWMDAIRAGRARTYIPENLIPRNQQTGELLRPNAFDNRFITVSDNMAEQGKNGIDTEQPNIPCDNYLNTYTVALELCLQGIISPSTLGVDVKKMDNAEAQREKEKTTLYTRGLIIEMLTDALSNLAKSVICAWQIWNGQAINVPEVIVKFGEYAAPGFESRISAVGEARTRGVMSLEACIDELYGDSKDDEWKEQEVARLKAEQGVVEMEETSVVNDIGFVV